MEVKLPSTVWLCLLVTFSLFVENLAASLFSKHQKKHGNHHHKSHPYHNHKHGQANSTLFNPKDKSCQCKAELTDGTPVANFGEVATYSMADGSCHHLHQKCRQTCTKFLDLHSHVPGSPTTTNGYHFCDLYGRVTSNSGVDIRMVWETINCHQRKFQKSLKTSRLCCGHTFIPLNIGSKHSTAKVFGWNPDCKAQTFIVSS